MLLIFFQRPHAEGVEAARQQRKNEGSPAKLLQPLQNASTNTLMLVLQPLQQLCQGPKEREPGGVGNFFESERTSTFLLRPYVTVVSALTRRKKVSNLKGVRESKAQSTKTSCQ